ncbi:putative F-actin-capping protein subunit beta-like [Trifolium pratense]|uniref:F-actin-capping protein subunit beta n=2 Tax=Trifolium TaxID=3898 RepID=A0A2K3PQR8_TRIPR|nr:putative F-actin-capping protein subunit beta-like [Trifolium pratense]
MAEIEGDVNHRIQADRMKWGMFHTKCWVVKSQESRLGIVENRDKNVMIDGSPWSNKYHPPLEDGSVPSSKMRKLESEANEIFAIYRDQYYEGGSSSVYMWEDENEGFVACFLIKKDGSKTGQGRRGYLEEGAWDAIHVIEVGPEEEENTSYRLTSTVMLTLTTNNEASGTFSLSGSIRRQMNMKLSFADGHLCNMGRMIEEMEGKLRNSLDQVYFGKTREMVCTLRPPSEVAQMRMPES